VMIMSGRPVKLKDAMSWERPPVGITMYITWLVYIVIAEKYVHDGGCDFDIIYWEIERMRGGES
jgi:hypothetical protein